MKKCILIRISFWIFFVINTYAQTSIKDTVLNMQEVSIFTTREIGLTTGSKRIAIDSLTLAHNTNSSLSDFFAQNNYLMVKSYSPGNLATISFRGTNPNHTALLWNGLNLQSAMNGQTDLSLIPIGFFDEASIQFGGGSALFGSGAIGGAIHIRNKQPFNKGIQVGVGANYGSFQHYQQTAKVLVITRKWASSIKTFNSDIVNNYTYEYDNGVSKSIRNQENASIKSFGIICDNSLKITSNQIFTIRYWGQKNHRQIPPTLLSSNKYEYQIDENHRLNAEWQLTKNNYSVAARTGYFREKIDFGIPELETFSNTAHVIVSEVESNIHLSNRFDFSLGINQTYTTAKGNNLISDSFINRVAGFGAIKYVSLSNRAKSTLSFREQFSENKWAPIMPSFGVELDIIQKWLQLRGTISRNYRLPTFNDLYWTGSQSKGNSLLLPEEGWSQELGVTSKKSNENIQLSISSSIYNSLINNWIYWHTNNNGILQPDNIQSVWARGIEINGQGIWKINKRINVSSEINYDYTESTVEQSNQPNLKGKQLIYVPYEKAFANLKTNFWNFSVSYHHAFTGFRYTQEDNLAYLPAFQVGSLNFNYSLSVSKIKADFFCRLNNIWNEKYQVIASRPMPLFNFLSGIYIQFNQPINQKIPTDKP
ncbi:MAG: TonB-dependent receptor [Bacteroidota bacterium]|nr:TonB-dependent receptor [Bacteroidota bacterium]